MLPQTPQAGNWQQDWQHTVPRASYKVNQRVRGVPESFGVERWTLDGPRKKEYEERAGPESLAMCFLITTNVPLRKTESRKSRRYRTKCNLKLSCDDEGSRSAVLTSQCNPRNANLVSSTSSPFHQFTAPSRLPPRHPQTLPTHRLPLPLFQREHRISPTHLLSTR